VAAAADVHGARPGPPPALQPGIRWVEAWVTFRFIERHHRIHHVHMGRNFNVVLPLPDAVMGTLMLRDPLPRRLTAPGAKRVARRHSRHGRELRGTGAPSGERPTAFDSTPSPGAE
jgi:hypothetical protein